MKRLLSILLPLSIYLNLSFGYDVDSCQLFKYCGGASRSSSPSIPKTSSSTHFNPGNISSIKGFGIETTYQYHNDIDVNLVSGNGKMGALISATNENSFFGNRSIEIDDLLQARMINKTQYKNKKLNLALGVKLLDKKHLGLSLGLSVKRNAEIKRINPGIGISTRIAFLNLGAYLYQDDIHLDLKNYTNPYTNTLYSAFYNSPTYREKFLVQTYTAGTKILNFAFDFAAIRTKYKFYPDKTKIDIYSSSFQIKKIIFNYALRNEISSNLDFVNGVMVKNLKKIDKYYGVQYQLNHFLLGAQYNNFLLNEWSATLTFLF